MKQLLILPLFLLFSFHTARENTPAPATGEQPKNIILMIGDGMGLTQITAGLYSNGKTLNLEKFPITGLIRTHSAKHIVTDSGAGATAFSCGCKTFNGAIGVCKDKTPCLTILEQAEQRGLATGLVATSSITHATPASFIAHVADRSEYEAIAAFFLQTDLDLLIGGGLKYFNQRSADQRNLEAELSAKGVAVSDFSKKKLSDLTLSPDQPFAWFSAVEEPGSAFQGRDYLPLAARISPDYLKKRSEKGFFLMIEGSQIDWACHANNAPDAVREMLDFDLAIGEALKFAQADGNTLVIVTADHETGGMALEQGHAKDSLDMEFNTAQHTATLVPVFAFGPGAERFGGIYDNTDIYLKMRDLLGFPEIAAEK
ncbi:MAG TPA: alkaline phosphatase, partial [Saprospiraceae bacterium]|nr:alkaline phosphatase [Saprospiraceae bacterium]